MLVEGLNLYTAQDKKNMNNAATVVTRRFGPSGSSKNTNIVLEDKIAVRPRISNEIFFDLKFISLIIPEIVGGGSGMKFEQIYFLNRKKAIIPPAILDKISCIASKIEGE